MEHSDEVLALADSVIASIDADLSGPAMDGFDLDGEAQLAAAEDDGADIPVLGVDGKPRYYKGKPVTINVSGKNSRKYRAAEAEISRRKLRIGKITAERLREDEIYKVAACTNGWYGIVHKGAEVRCDRQNAQQIYRAFPHVLNQMMEAMDDHDVFTENSSPTP